MAEDEVGCNVVGVWPCCFGVLLPPLAPAPALRAGTEVGVVEVLVTALGVCSRLPASCQTPTPSALERDRGGGTRGHAPHDLVVMRVQPTERPRRLQLTDRGVCLSVEHDGRLRGADVPADTWLRARPVVVAEHHGRDEDGVGLRLRVRCRRVALRRAGGDRGPARPVARGRRRLEADPRRRDLAQRALGRAEQVRRVRREHVGATELLRVRVVHRRAGVRPLRHAAEGPEDSAGSS